MATQSSTTKQKNRMSQVDIRAIVAELKKEIVGLRLSNIYDLNSKTYMLKFAKPDHKIHLLVESGIRLHTTKFERDKSQMPAAFTLKLRKYIRTRRCEKVDQLGVDRVIDITFGQEEKSYHLIVEFFAKGNVILTDPNYQILALLRTHKKEKDTAGVFAVGEVYPMGARRQFAPINRDLLTTIFRDNKDEKVNLKNLLGNSTDYGPGFTEHVILKSGLNPSTKVNELKDLKQFVTGEANAAGQKIFDSLMKGFQEADNFIAFKDDAVQRGYIILADEKPSQNEATPVASNNQELTKLEQLDIEKQEKEKQRERYEDFTPFLYQQYVNRPFLLFDTFDHAVDEYFSAVETMKLDTQKQQVESSVYKKLHKIKQEQENRINELEEDKARMEYAASLIEQNLDLVDQAIEIIVSGVSDYSWEEIERVVKTQKKLGDPVASAINQLKLENNTITMLLSPQEADVSDDDSDNEDVQKGPQKVDIDISLTAYGNAQFYYSLRKKSNEKQEKTVAASHKAIKIAEKKTVETLKQKQIKAEIQLMRKKFWWEKFNWFISSENYLVLSGRDALQNEMLVKRYMRKGDVYVHADVHGASTCIIKNHAYDSSLDENICTVPPQTLHEAGMMTVCRSNAWDAKVVANAYWVHAHQVSKSAPTGEYLPTGSFMVRGKKNYLPPCQLVMGLAVMFKLDEESIPNHLGERKRKDLANDDAISVASMESGSTWEEESINSPRSQNSNEDAEKDPQDQPEETEEKEKEQEEEDQENETESEEEEEKEEEQQQQPQRKQQNAAAKDTQKKKKGLSAKDKKKLKKMKKQGVDEKEAKELLLNDVAPKSEEKKTDDTTKSSEPVDLTKKPKGVKKGKWKKMKKYADQDEEERKLRMELIGHKYVSPSERVNKKQVAEEKEKQQELEKQQLDSEKKKKEKEEIKKLLEEENIQYMDDEDREKLTEIDALTGQPRDEDIILFAVPVCAPYSTLRNYKYKVKIVPGSQKRGKAGTQGMHILAAEAKATPREETLVKTISEPDVTAVMVGNCRIATAIGKTKSYLSRSGKPKKKAAKKDD